MAFNLRLESGIYDSDLSSVRASLFKEYFGFYSKFGCECFDITVNAKELERKIKQLKFKVEKKFMSTWSDGEERISFHYIIKSKVKTLLLTSKRFYERLPDLDEDGEPFAGKRMNDNPNKFSYIAFYSESSQKVEEFKKFIKSIIDPEETRNKLYMLKQSEFGGLSLDSFPIKCNVDLELNYGKDFVEFHESLLSHLCNKKSGLYIFHGLPGTGKTSYIKYLTTVEENRRFIFVPNTMIGNIFSPKFVDKLYSFRNSVLVLEDAEICLLKRDGTNNELVSGILNITDGLLKDLLNISIFVTFNSTDIKDLDKALLRKGRLQMMRSFGLLSVEDARRLAKKLNMKKDINVPMSLADVYNLDESTGLEEEEIKSSNFGFASR